MSKPRPAARLWPVSIRTAGLLAGVFLLALAVRFMPYASAMKGGLRLMSTDSYGHLRRSTLVARQFPRVPFHDPYLNHPDGAIFIWPPAWDFTVGGLARLLFGREVTQDQVALVSATWPPVLGALHIPLLFFAVSSLFGRRRAFIATGVYAVLPAAAVWSCFGHADHHVAEVFSLLVFLSVFVAAAREKSPGRKRGLSVMAGIALGTTLLTWQGAVFVVGLALPLALILGPSLAAVLGLSASLTASLGTWAFLAGEHVPFSFISFGWFQPLFTLAGTLPLTALAFLFARRLSMRLFWLAASLSLAVIAIPNSGRLLGAVLRGSAHLAAGQLEAGKDDFSDGGYLSYPSELLGVIAEAQPLLKKPVMGNLTRAISELSVGLPILVLAIGLWAWQGIRGKPDRLRLRLVFAVFALALLLMTLGQRRNVYYLALFTALALAEAVARFQVRFRMSSVSAGVLAGSLLALSTGARPLRQMRAYAEAPGRDLLDTLRRLAELDPPAVPPFAVPRPEPGVIAGVFCPWAAGHMVTSITGRPAAADPNAYGWRRQCRLFSATEEEAERILLAAKCRYLLTMNLRTVLPLYAAAAGRPPATPVDEMFAVKVHESVSPRPFPFLELVLDSRTGMRRAGGGFQPAYRVWRIRTPGA